MTALTLDPWSEGWTVADVNALPENGVRYELVDGVPRPMTLPTLVVAYGLDAEIGRAAAGEQLTLIEPFPVTFDPAQLSR